MVDGENRLHITDICIVTWALPFLHKYIVMNNGWRDDSLLRVLAPLPKDLSSVPRTYTGQSQLL